MTHEESMMKAIETALPAVVSIVIGKEKASVEKEISGELWKEIEETAKEEKSPITREEFLDHMPRLVDGKIRVGWGSGFIVSKEGHVLTNKHVVLDADAEYMVTTAADDSYAARVLARDPLNDVAILKIDGDNFPAVELGDSNRVRLGQAAIALGNALGEFQNTASAGIISGLSRFLTAATDDNGHAEHLSGLIQTDAAINPGNSGGPLVNLKGEVIGINVATVAGAENIGFAIPINRAKRDLEDIKKFGRIKKPFLGIRYVPVTQELKRKLRLPADYGLLVSGEKIPGYEGVLKGGPAAKAGVEDYDIILAADDAPLSETHTLEDVLESAAIGQELRLEILRGGEKKEFQVTLEERK